MSEYFDRVHGSSAVADLQNLETKLADLRKRRWEHQNTVDLLERLMVVNANVLKRLNLSDCSLITLTTLNELESQSRQLLHLVDQLDPLPLDGQPNIAQINETADQLLRSASTMPAVQHPTLADDMHSAAEQFRREAESASGSMRKEYDEVKIQLDSVRSELQNFSEQSKEILPQTQEMVTQQTAQRQADLNSLQSRVQQAISTLGGVVKVRV